MTVIGIICRKWPNKWFTRGEMDDKVVHFWNPFKSIRQYSRFVLPDYIDGKNQLTAVTTDDHKVYQ